MKLLRVIVELSRVLLSEPMIPKGRDTHIHLTNEISIPTYIQI